MGIGLRARGAIGRQWRPEIAETRHRNDSQSGLDQRLPELESLVVATARAVDQQYRRAFSCDSIFDPPAASVGDTTARWQALIGSPHIASITGISDRHYSGASEAGKDQHCSSA